MYACRHGFVFNFSKQTCSDDNSKEAHIEKIESSQYFTQLVCIIKDKRYTYMMNGISYQTHNCASLWDEEM